MDVIKRKFVISVYRTLTSFFCGAAITQLLTDIAKYSIGRLRPHFYTVCKPSIQNCTWNSGYIEDYDCTGTDLEAIQEARYLSPNIDSIMMLRNFILYKKYKFDLLSVISEYRYLFHVTCWCDFRMFVNFETCLLIEMYINYIVDCPFHLVTVPLQCIVCSF